ncbi:MAG TPA: hypothetical protein VMU73_08525 [Gaiellaceae bacterium]|nr:hypothetical protein [Gaiellaceae bacterium]
MSPAAWIALAFLLVALAGSVAFAALRGLRVWRSFRAFSTTTGAALDSVMRTASAAEEHAASLAAGAERLARANEHLQSSLAELGLLRDAAGEARASVARLRGAVPRK